jgi:oxygen-independent coproporphyrinogen III oxidase
MELMCQFQLSQEHLESKYHLSFDRDFNEYFASERLALKTLEADGLVEIFPDLIKVTPAGRLLIRNVAAVFDQYLQHQPARTFSQSV